MKLDRHGMNTVIDQEVALAAAAQGLAPAGAAPPLMVGMLAKKQHQELYIGAPTMPGVHRRASALKTELAPNPQADAFSQAEIKRRMKLGGFYCHERMSDGKTCFDMMQIKAISGDHTPVLGESTWEYELPQVPMNMAGLQGKVPRGGPELTKKARWQRGSQLINRATPSNGKF